MWVLGMLDDDDYIRNLLDLGMRYEDAIKHLSWLKVEGLLPSIKERFRNLWIGPAEVMAELLATGVPAHIATRIYQTQVVNYDAPLRIAREKDLTKLDITKAFKTEFITFEDGVGLLMDIGYDQNEAELILLINQPKVKEV